MDTALIGRDRECAALQGLLRRDDVGLVSVTGPGGIGKTRLALEVAARARSNFEHGVTMVLLAAVREPEFVITSIAKALGLEGQGSVPPLQRVTAFLQDKHPLLVLDNFEQLMQAAPVVGELLAQAPGVKVLVTSRMRLHVSREHEVGLGALGLPDPRALDPDDARRAPAVALFVQRAQAVQPGFALRADNVRAVAAICTRLDGWPLAIELAAARLKLLGPEQMLKRLGKRLPLLTGGPVDGPLRQRTMRGTLDWSHDLLSEAERKLFAELSVFKAGATLEAIESVCGDVPALLETLQALVDHSLVVQADGRFTMLETLREYASERLDERGGADAAKLRHANYYLAQAEHAETQLRGRGQRAWFATLDCELDNAREAMSWALGTPHAALALRHAAALGMFWVSGGRASEGLRWLQKALASCADASDAIRAKAIGWGGAASLRAGDMQSGREMAEEALRRYRELNDRAGLARVCTDLGWALLWGQGDMAGARAAFEEALAVSHDIGDAAAEGRAAVALGVLCTDGGAYAEALAHLESGLALSMTAGDDLRIANALANLARLCDENLDRPDDARRYEEQALRIQREMGDRVNCAICLINLADTAQRQGDFARACEGFKEGLGESYAVGDLRVFAIGLGEMTHLCLETGQHRVAAVLLAACEALCQRHGFVPAPSQAEGARARRDRTRELLGDEAFEQASAEGRLLSFSKALSIVNSIEVGSPVLPLPATVDDRTRGIALDLTPREREVVALVAQGLTDRQIGERLEISGATASKHVANLLAKTQQRNRLALAIWARGQGLAGPD